MNQSIIDSLDRAIDNIHLMMDALGDDACDAARTFHDSSKAVQLDLARAEALYEKERPSGYAVAQTGRE